MTGSLRSDQSVSLVLCDMPKAERSIEFGGWAAVENEVRK